MKIQFLGAAGTVTGSCFLFSDNDQQNLVDMGMFQGHYELESLNWKPLPFDPRLISNVFLTHAHLDHTGRLPLLFKHGFRGKIFSTQATRDIAEIVLMDAARIMSGDDERPLLYTEVDVARTIDNIEVISYGKVLELPGMKVTYRDAGHILGSASIEIHNLSDGKNYLFSGDLGNSPEDLVKPFEYIKSADVVVMESTYGDRSHPQENTDKLFLKEINEVEYTSGSLLIPSFSVERTQALLHRIGHFKKNGEMKAQTPVFLDSPMGEKVTEIYKKYPQLYGEELSQDKQGGDPFNFPELRIVTDRKMSERVPERPGPKIIIAGSGMMTGGRILDHAMKLLPSPLTRLLIVGFQAEHTVGRALEEGAKSVHIYGQEVKVNATISTIHSMSAHADQPKLLDWLRHIKGVTKVFLVHGEDKPRNAFKEKISELGINEVILPNQEDSFTI
jgi:metallo-beta-lactamase family protein